MSKNIVFTDGTEIPIGIMFCVGSNYSKHALEMGSTVSSEPVIFLKPPKAYIQSGETISLPDFSEMVHHEVELVIIIGKDCENIRKEEADEYIAGYAVGIDVTLRDIQNQAKKDGKPWAVSKGFVTSAPISPAVPKASIADASCNFDLLLKVNGEIKQFVNTMEMERSVSSIIEFLSQVFTLQAGDIIFTGTPEGVGPIEHGDHLHAELVGYTSLDVTVE